MPKSVGQAFSCGTWLAILPVMPGGSITLCLASRGAAHFRDQAMLPAFKTKAKPASWVTVWSSAINKKEERFFKEFPCAFRIATPCKVCGPAVSRAF